jgi:hypothetical protein
MILKVDAMHMLVKTLCTCSCRMVLMMQVSPTRLPINKIVLARAITGREKALDGDSHSHNQDT